MSTILELSVPMDCPGCENKIKKALQKLDGVENVDIDMDMQKVIVTGWVDQEKVLKTVRKTGRTAELWPLPYNPEYHDFNEYYYDQYQHKIHPPTNYFVAGPEPVFTYNYSDQYQHKIHPPTNYFVAEPEPVFTYNYDVHGYNGHDHGYYRQPPYSVFNEPNSAMFSDENAHACSIM